jgi:hypothetical protein
MKHHQFFDPRFSFALYHKKGESFIEMKEQGFMTGNAFNPDFSIGKFCQMKILFLSIK